MVEIAQFRDIQAITGKDAVPANLLTLIARTNELNAKCARGYVIGTDLCVLIALYEEWGNKDCESFESCREYQIWMRDTPEPKPKTARAKKELIASG